MKSHRIATDDDVLNGPLVQKSNEVEKVGIEAFHRHEFGKSRPLQTDARWVSNWPQRLGVLVDSEEAV